MIDIKQAWRDAEERFALAHVGTDIGPTGATIIKHRKSPVTCLIESGAIGPEELQAAQEIYRAAMSIAGGVSVMPINYDRVDVSMRGDGRAISADLVNSYRQWANHWSGRQSPLFQIVWHCVIDETPIAQIARRLGINQRTAQRGLIIGLRDYAARSGFAPNRLLISWKAAAERFYRRKARLT